jgi:hypothetical protein
MLSTLSWSSLITIPNHINHFLMCATWYGVLYNLLGSQLVLVLQTPWSVTGQYTILKIPLSFSNIKFHGLNVIFRISYT